MNYPKITSIKNSMSVLSDILPILLGLVAMRVGGTVNATNPTAADHDEILKAMGHSGYELVTLTEQKTMLKAGRSNNYLTTHKIERLHAEIPVELKRKYKVPEKLKPLLERIKDISVIRKGTDHRVIPATVAPGRKILVTGGAGFIASNYINEHLERYPTDFIVNLDRLDKCSNLALVSATERYKFVKGDISNIDLVSLLLTDFKIEYVMHFAAQTHVNLSFGNALDTFDNNLSGTHRLVEACTRYGKLKKFVLVSTAEVYGDF